MSKLVVLVIGSVLNLILVVLGGFLYINWQLTRKYKILTVIIPSKYTIADFSHPGLFGGVVYLNEDTITYAEEYVNFLMLHEKGHCRTWRGIPTLNDTLVAMTGASVGHGRKTAAYEYAADKYAADKGALEEGIEFLQTMYQYQDRDQVRALGGDVRDPLRRANALRRMK